MLGPWTRRVLVWLLQAQGPPPCPLRTRAAWTQHVLDVCGAKPPKVPQPVGRNPAPTHSTASSKAACASWLTPKQGPEHWPLWPRRHGPLRVLGPLLATSTARVQSALDETDGHGTKPGADRSGPSGEWSGRHRTQRQRRPWDCTARQHTTSWLWPSRVQQSRAHPVIPSPGKTQTQVHLERHLLAHMAPFHPDLCSSAHHGPTCLEGDQLVPAYEWSWLLGPLGTARCPGRRQTLREGEGPVRPGQGEAVPAVRKAGHLRCLPSGLQLP